MTGFSVRRAFPAWMTLLFLAASTAAAAGPGGGRAHSPKEEGGFLGVSVQELTPALQEALHIDGLGGVLVSQVLEESPAAEAGLEVGDVLVALDGKEIGSPREFSRMVGARPPGTRSEINLIRDSKKRTVRAEIGSRRDRAATIGETIASGSGAAWLGVRLHDPDADLASYFGIKTGGGALVLGVDEGSPAEAAGIRSGDVIVRIGDTDIGASADVVRAIGAHEPGDEVSLRVLRREKKIEIDATLGERPGGSGAAPMTRFRPFPEAPPGRIGQYHRFGETMQSELDGLRREMDKLRDEIERMKEK